MPTDPSHSNRRRRFISLRLSMAAAFGLAVIATSALIGVSTFFAARGFIRDGLRQRLQDIVTLAAERLTAAKTTNVGVIAKLQRPDDERTPEYARLKDYLQEIKQVSNDIRFVYLYRVDAAGTVTYVADNEPETSKDISHLGDIYKDATELMRTVYKPGAPAAAERELSRDQWGVWLSAYAPLVGPDGRMECALGADMSAAAVYHYERRTLFTLIGVTMLGSVVVLFASLGISRRVSHPLLLLAEDLGRVQRLDLDRDFEIHSIVREVVVMRDAIRNLKASLRSFRKYVPADLVADLMTLGQEARLSAEKREVTLLFSDIADFTAISEKTPPEELVGRLSVYFDGMTRAIVDRKGTVDKYIGDAIMAFWGAPHPLPDHAVQACLAALHCRDHSRRLAEEQRHAGGLPMRTRFGLNTGVAIIGNIGYDERLNYTAMGDTVNLASRLEGLNKYYGTDILISEDTRAQVREFVEARFIDVVAVKGKSIPVRIYELICERGDLTAAQSQLLHEYERGLELYLARRFAEAIEVFQELTTAFPDDAASALMLERARKLLLEPPGEGWQGEVIMKTK